MAVIANPKGEAIQKGHNALDCRAPLAMTGSPLAMTGGHRHCEERSDEAIQKGVTPWIASLRSQ
jgi:hypothetical protein